MALPKGLQFEKKETNTKYPSLYGPHKKMLDESYKTNDLKYVVCKDDEGPYVTEAVNLDKGVADPYRYSIARASLLEKFAVAQ